MLCEKELEKICINSYCQPKLNTHPSIANNNTKIFLVPQALKKINRKQETGKTESQKFFQTGKGSSQQVSVSYLNAQGNSTKRPSYFVPMKVPVIQVLHRYYLFTKTPSHFLFWKPPLNHKYY